MFIILFGARGETRGKIGKTFYKKFKETGCKVLGIEKKNNNKKFTRVLQKNKSSKIFPSNSKTESTSSLSRLALTTTPLLLKKFLSTKNKTVSSNE